MTPITRPLRAIALALIVAQSLTAPAAGAAPPEYDVPVAVLDRDGKPAAQAQVLVVDKSTGEGRSASTGATLRLPKGEYLVHASLGDNDVYYLIQPSFTVNAGTRLSLDFRAAKPVQITLDQPELRHRSTVFSLAAQLGTGNRYAVSDRVDAPNRLYLGMIGPAVDPKELVATIIQQWAVPGATGDFKDSPAEAQTYDVRRGTFFNGLTRQVKAAELAKVVSVYRAERQDSSALTHLTPAGPEYPGGWLPPSLHFTRVPKTLTRLVEGRGASWKDRYLEWTQLPPGFPPQGDDVFTVSSLRQAPIQYEPGRTYREEWNKGGFGPWIGSNGNPAVFRLNEGVYVGLPLFGDPLGRRGTSYADRSSVRLLRDGQVIGSAANGEAGLLSVEKVAPGAATYRLEATAKRTVQSVATEVTAAWTFRWDWAEGLTRNPRLWSVRFHPQLDAANRLAKRPVVVLPMTLDAQRGSGPGTLRTPQVRFSTDDGKSWTAAKVRPAARGSYSVEVRPAAAARALSLRVTAGDDQGNRLEQTVKTAFIFG